MLGQWQNRWCLALLLGFFAHDALPRLRAEPAVEERLRRDVTYLASDECEGRGVSTKGINLAADYIAGEFKKAGLKPGAGKDGYFQPFTMSGPAELKGPNVVVLHGPDGKEIELKQDKDFRVLGLSASGKITAPVVFAGYAATAKEIGYDDFNGIDVAGKVVVIVRRTPQAKDKKPFDGDRSAHHAALVTKLVNAGQHKAAAVLFVSDPDSAKDKDELMSFDYASSDSAPSQVVAVHVHRKLADTLLDSSAGRGLAAIEAEINQDLKPRSIALSGWTASVEAHVVRSTLNVKNVVGVVDGAGPLANETVVIGAHYDHLGYGGRSSLARNVKGPAIHHGADDNASGTTALLEAARYFGRMQGRQGRRLVFMAFSGEESGLLGSRYYCSHPLFKLEDTVAMVNMDMVGRLRLDKSTWRAVTALLTPPARAPLPAVALATVAQAEREIVLSPKELLIVYGTGTAKTFDPLIEKLNQDYHFKLKKVPTGMGPSDQESFYLKKIPVVFFFTDDHPDYHRPSDTADKINVVGMGKIVDLVEKVVGRLASEPERPQYVKVAGGSGRSPSVRGPRIGIRPSYGDESDAGVLLEGVVEGGPAAKAGLKEGDRIVDVGGKPVKNLETYMVLIAGHKAGQPLELGILRGGKKSSVKVTPE